MKDTAALLWRHRRVGRKMYRIVDLLYRMGLITFTDEEAPDGGAAQD